MLVTSLVFPEHAAQRLSQRNLHPADVYYVCEHGSRSIVAGAIHIFLRRKNVRAEDRRNDRINRLIGTTVLLDSHDAKTVLTVYRNREAPKRNRRKAKYKRKSSRPSSAPQLSLAA